MARTYRRDARGRFAGGGYSGQTGGRGARLMAKGQRNGGGAKIQAGKIGGTLRKPKGLKPDPQARKRGTRGTLNREGVLGKVAQRRGLQKAAQGAMQRLGIKDRPSTQRRMARPSGILSKRVGQMKVSGVVTMNDRARVTRGLGRAERRAAKPVNTIKPIGKTPTGKGSASQRKSALIREETFRDYRGQGNKTRMAYIRAQTQRKLGELRSSFGSGSKAARRAANR